MGIRSATFLLFEKKKKNGVLNWGKKKVRKQNERKGIQSKVRQKRLSSPLVGVVNSTTGRDARARLCRHRVFNISQLWGTLFVGEECRRGLVSHPVLRSSSLYILRVDASTVTYCSHTSAEGLLTGCRISPDW